METIEDKIIEDSKPQDPQPITDIPQPSPQNSPLSSPQKQDQAISLQSPFPNSSTSISNPPNPVEQQIPLEPNPPESQSRNIQNSNPIDKINDKEINEEKPLSQKVQKAELTNPLVKESPYKNQINSINNSFLIAKHKLLKTLQNPKKEGILEFIFKIINRQLSILSSMIENNTTDINSLQPKNITDLTKEITNLFNQIESSMKTKNMLNNFKISPQDTFALYKKTYDFVYKDKHLFKDIGVISGSYEARKKYDSSISKKIFVRPRKIVTEKDKMHPVSENHTEVNNNPNNISSRSNSNVNVNVNQSVNLNQNHKDIFRPKVNLLKKTNSPKPSQKEKSVSKSESKESNFKQINPSKIKSSTPSSVNMQNQNNQNKQQSTNKPKQIKTSQSNKNIKLRQGFDGKDSIFNYAQYIGDSEKIEEKNGVRPSNYTKNLVDKYKNLVEQYERFDDEDLKENEGKYQKKKTSTNINSKNNNRNDNNKLIKSSSNSNNFDVEDFIKKHQSEINRESKCSFLWEGSNKKNNNSVNRYRNANLKGERASSNSNRSYGDKNASRTVENKQQEGSLTGKSSKANVCSYKGNSAKESLNSERK